MGYAQPGTSPLELVERRRPEPSRNTVRIAVEACGVCHSDVLTKSGAFPGIALPRVPVLYRGPFARAVLREHTDGRETVSGKSPHVREGVVIRPQVERHHPELGRVQLKSVSEKYLLRSGGTEYN